MRRESGGSFEVKKTEYFFVRFNTRFLNTKYFISRITWKMIDGKLEKSRRDKRCFLIRSSIDLLRLASKMKQRRNDAIKNL